MHITIPLLGCPDCRFLLHCGAYSSQCAPATNLSSPFYFSICTCVIFTLQYIDYESIVLSYFYYGCFTMCLVAALFVLTVSTVANVFGPTMALKGSTDDSVKTAANKMMSIQIQVLQVAAVAISALFLGACLLSECALSCLCLYAAVIYRSSPWCDVGWSNYPPGIATICTVFYIVTYYFLIIEGFKVHPSIPSSLLSSSILFSAPPVRRPTAPSSRTKML